MGSASYSWLSITQIRREGDETQICSRQWEFKLLNVIFYKFYSEGSFALKVVCE